MNSLRQAHFVMRGTCVSVLFFFVVHVSVHVSKHSSHEESVCGGLAYSALMRQAVLQASGLL